jgi:ABC-type multidrug transport system ATPase subunit
VNPDAEATEAVPTAAASETGIAGSGGIAASPDPQEQAGRRPTARRKPVPPVQGGGAIPARPAPARAAERHKPSTDAENASPDRAPAEPAAETAQPGAGRKPSRRVTRPVTSPTPVIPPRNQAAGVAPAAAKPSAVRAPKAAEPPAERSAGAPSVAERSVAQPAVAQPVNAEPAAVEELSAEPVTHAEPGVQPSAADSAVEATRGTRSAVRTATAASGATAVTAAQPTPAVRVPEPAASVAASTARTGVPPREPKLKRQKGPAAGAVRPLDPPRQRVDVVLAINDLVKRFGPTTAVGGVTLQVRAGSFFGLVGPNGAGKTTTLSMVTGLLRPDAGSVIVHGADVWSNPVVAKRNMGVLPDSLRLFDRLTGAQLLYYAGVLRGLDAPTVQSRTLDLAEAFGLTDALDRLVTDYSAGMTKKIALAAAMIHSPRLLVLDEPFESVDPVSAANVTEILQRYVAAGGTVVLSSHSMDLIQRICDDVAIVVNGRILASGPVDQVRGNSTLEERFVELAGGRRAAEGMEWLHSFSD